MYKQILFSFIICWLCAGCGQSAGQMVAQGNQAFAQGNYDQAQQAYQSAQMLVPTAAEPVYNLANTFYRQGIYTQTQQLLPQAVAGAEGTLAGAGYYNLGNANYQTQQWAQAIDAYKETLRRNPDDQDAKHNLELALRHLQQQQQGQQPQDQQQNDQNQQDDQNKQNDQSQQKQDQQPNQQQGTRDQKTPTAQPSSGNQPGSTPTPQPQQQANNGSGADKQNGAATPNAPQPGATAVTGLTPEQARQLIGTVGKQTKTLQEQIQGVYVIPGPTPDKDW